MSAFGSPRRILVAVVVLASTALVFVVGAHYRATQAVAASVVRGQADALLSAVRLQLPMDPTPRSLDEILAAQHADGLRYIAIESRPDRRPGNGPGKGPSKGPGKRPHPGRSEAPHRIEAGSSLMGHHRPRPGEIIAGGDRVLAVAAVPPPPPGPRARHPRPPPMGHIIIEFEPVAWTDLDTSAKRQVAGGVFVLFALFVTFLLGWRALARTETQAIMLAKQKRLAMLGEMSGTLAHEIRNPLTSLKGHAQLLLESATDERDQSRARRIVAEAVRLETLTTDLLTFLRSGEIEVSDGDPVELLEDVRDGEPRVTLMTKNAPRSWPFDAPRLRQALANLMENALQAGDGEVVISIDRDADILVFRVDDRGDGIAESVRERLFEPFVASRTRGTGLGLAVAMRIAEAHGGTIEATSREGGGARFVLTVQRKQHE